MRIQGKFIESYKVDWTTLDVRTFTHNLGTTDLQISLWDIATNRMVLPDEAEVIDANKLQISVSALPVSGIRVIIMGL